MELLLYAALFCLWQSAVVLSPSASAIASFGGRCRPLRGPGPRLLSPWPGDLAIVFELPAREPPEGKPGGPEGEPFCLAAFDAELESARRDTRLLRRCCEAYALLVFGGVPALLLRWGAEAAWSLALPAIGVVHLGSLAALHLAERRWRPPHRAERWVTASLFPPALLRTPADLVAARVARFDPATAAASLLDEERFVRLLRGEIGRLRPAAAEGSAERAGPPDAAAWRCRLREQLLSLCEQRGVDRGRVLTPVRAHVGAASYCPICLDEFLVERGRCPGCGTSSVAFP